MDDEQQMPSWKLATLLALQQQLWFWEAFRRLTRLLKRLVLSGITKSTTPLVRRMNGYPVDSPFDQQAFIPGHHIQRATGSSLSVYGTVYQKTISIFKLSFSLSRKKNVLFFSQQAKLGPSGKVWVLVKCPRLSCKPFQDIHTAPVSL